MSYKYETQHNARNKTLAINSPGTFGYARRITGITIHHWGSPGQSHDGVVNWFCYDPECGTSAHYVTSAGRVTQIVADRDVAWHSGHPRGNAETIGIECRPEMSPADFETVCELVADLWKAYGKVRLYRHNEWQSTACPGLYGPQMDAIASRAGEILAGRQKTAGAAAKPAATGYVHKPGVKKYHTVKKGDTVSKLVKYYGSRTDLIKKWNDLADVNKIQPGQKLRVR